MDSHQTAEIFARKLDDITKSVEEVAEMIGAPPQEILLDMIEILDKENQ